MPPLTILPANLMEDQVPMEFDMDARGAARAAGDQAAIEAAVAERRNDIRQMLVDFGVPLIKCDECTVSGDLPSHGPYKAPTTQGANGRRDRKNSCGQNGRSQEMAGSGRESRR